MSGTMYLSPSPVLQFFDNNGNLAAGYKLFTYAAGTTTKQSAFTDSSGDTPLPNPIVLNARGEVAPSATGTSCGLWLDPALNYKFVLATADDTDPPTDAIWSIDNIVSPQSTVLAALQAYQATLTAVPIGGQIPYGGSAAPSGFLLCYGQAVSRTTYAALFAVVGTSYGIGNGTSTFNLPDKRGRASIGKDDMGGAPANRVTNAIAGFDATILGNAGGDQHAQEDTINCSSTVSSAVTDPGHTHLMSIQNNGGGGADGQPTSIGGADIADSPSIKPAFTNITVNVSVATTATSTLTGQSQNVQPSQVDNWIIATGVA